MKSFTSSKGIARHPSRIVKLREVVVLEYGSSLPSKARVEGSIPVFGSNGQVGFHNTALVKGPGIVVGRKGSIGKTVWADSDFWPIDTTYYVRTSQDPKFIYYLLNNLSLDQLNRSTGVPGLNREDVYELKVALPSIESQRCIAEIVSAADKSIATTELVIAGSEKLKTALLDQLLTRGIGHTKFKQTEIGEIPENWRFASLSEAIDFQEGPGILAKDFHESGVPLIRLEGINSNSLLSGCNYLDPILVKKKWSHFRLRKGDILLSSSASLGQVATVDEVAAGAIVYTGIIRFRPKNEAVDAEFLKHFLKSNFFQKQISSHDTGSTIRHFGPTHLKKVQFMIPTIKEQKIIAQRLDCVDQKIEISKRIKLKQSLLRRGLMQDLLNQRTRV